MSTPLVWEDIEEGMVVPSLVKLPTTQMLVKYAGASGDFYQIHYDHAFALEKGLPGVIIHGALKSAFLGQMLTDWIGESGTLKKLACQYCEYRPVANISESIFSTKLGPYSSQRCANTSVSQSVLNLCPFLESSFFNSP